LVLVFLTWG